MALIAALLGFALWFLQREIRNNGVAHWELKKEIGDTRRDLKADIKAVEADIKAVEADVKQLLAGQSRIEGLLEALVVRGKFLNAVEAHRAADLPLRAARDMEDLRCSRAPQPGWGGRSRQSSASDLASPRDVQFDTDSA